MGQTRTTKTWAVTIRERASGRAERLAIRATTPHWAARRALHRQGEGWVVSDVTRVPDERGADDRPWDVMVRFSAPALTAWGAEARVGQALSDAEDGDPAALRALGWTLIESASGV